VAIGGVYRRGRFHLGASAVTLRYAATDAKDVYQNGHTRSNER